MYKCLECGHIFDEGEWSVWSETHGFSDGRYEKQTGCPICRSAYEKTVSCKRCGGEYLEDELYDGWCEDCLRDAVTYDLFLEYLQETNSLAQFMFVKFYGTGVPGGMNEKLLGALKDRYGRMKNDDRIRGVFEFLTLCKEFVMDDDGDFGRTDYAEWLNSREEA